MLSRKSIAEIVAVLGCLAAVSACSGSQTPTPEGDASAQTDDQPMSGGSDMPSTHNSTHPDPSEGAKSNEVSSAFDTNGEPIPGADGDIGPDAKRPPKPPATASASASAAPSAGPPKKGPPGKK